MDKNGAASAMDAASPRGVLDWVAFGLACVVGVLGGLVMIEWLILPAGERVAFPGALPVAFNKALCFAAAAAAMVVRRRHPRVALALATVVGSIAGLTMAEYILNVPLGIDQLVVDQYVPSLDGTPGRMSFSSAAALTFLALAIAGTIRWPGDPLAAVFALAGSAVAAGLIIEGYAHVLLIPSDAAHSPLTEVSPATVGLVVALAAAVAASVARTLAAARPMRIDHYLAWTTTVIAGMILVIWQYQERADWAQRSYETTLATDTAVSNLSIQLAERAEAQMRLADRWSIYGQPTEAEWLADAQVLLKDFPGIFAIAYTDRTRIVRWRVSQDGKNEGFIGRSLDRDDGRRAAFERSTALNQVVVTPSINLFSGARGNVFFTPIFNNGVLQGHIVASITASNLVELTRARGLQGFNIAITDGGGLVGGVLPTPDEPGYRIAKRGTVDTLGQTWTVEVWPSRAYLVERRSSQSVLTIVLGMIGVMLVAVAFAQTRDSLLYRSRAQESADRLALTLATIDEGFVTIDRDLTVTYANRKTAEVLGLGGGAFDGRVLTHLSPILGSAGVQAALDRVRRGQTSDRVVEHNPMTGQWIEITLHAIADGTAVYLRDVTADRARDSQLRLLEAAVSRLNDLVIITETDRGDGEGPRMVYVNEAFTRVTGYSREDAIGRSPRFLRGPHTARSELDRIKAALKAQQPVRAELLNYTKDGREYWIELDIAPMSDPEGNTRHYVAVERDITERKRTQEAAAIMDERFKLVVSATNDVIWDLDVASDRVWYNDNMRTMFGYDPVADQDVLRDWYALIHPEDRARVVAASEAALAGGDDTLNNEYRLRRADGSYAYIADRARIIRDSDGRPTRLIGAMVDQTTRRELDLRLLQAQRLESVGQLTGGVAHDFNNLLTVILGNTEVLREKLAGQPALRSTIDTMAMAATRGAELTSRLLAFARRQPLDPKTIDMNDLIRGMTELMRRTLPETVALDVRPGAGLGPIKADPAQVESSILNLVLNARDAMPKGGAITIETANVTLTAQDVVQYPDAAPGPYVEVSVSDTGHGMTPEVLARALEPFFTTKDAGRGSGLGLSIVYGFVRQSSGVLRIDTAEGKGTRVALCFPRAAAAAAATEKAAGQAASPGGHEHILVVEDDDLVRDSVCRQLELQGYAVTAVATGAAALAKLREPNTFDLLFTDVVMPGGMGGLELAEAARAIDPDLRILFTSGYSNEMFSQEGNPTPGILLLTKPYRMRELAEKVRLALKRS